MNTKFDISLMANVAKMYYIDNLKQDEIASQLQISRSMVSMILTEAKEIGVVDIHIRNPMLNNDALAEQIKSSFDLKDCIVIPTAIQDANTLRKLVAQRATVVFNTLIDNQNVVGINWGRTCYEFISTYISNHDCKDIRVVPLIGGSSQTAVYFQINEMVRLLAEKLKGIPYFIHSPVLASSEAEKEGYLKSSSLQILIDKWRNIDILVTGIGTLPDFNSNEREAFIGEFEIYKELEQNKAVGDICARYFNFQGELINNCFQKRIVGIPVEDLKNAKTVIGIAANPEKGYAVVGALRTDIIDILITDEQTAKALIKIKMQNSVKGVLG